VFHILLLNFEDYEV